MLSNRDGAANKRPRLRIKPLRNPGQSLDEELDKLVNDQAFTYVWSAACLVLLALYEWVAYLLDIPRQPGLFSICAAVAIGVLAIKFPKLRRRARAIRLGRDGERLVGQLLESLRADGAIVLHDIPGHGFNVDHLVVSDRGVLVVETKTLSKPTSNARISFAGDQILYDGKKPRRDPIRQVRAQAKWIADLLAESTGRRFPVRSAVLFPQWWVEPAPESIRKDVWVLEPKALPAFLKNEPRRLASEDVNLIASRLKSYVESHTG